MEPLELQELGPSEYPAQLREVPKPPDRLWTLGTWPSPGTKLLTVVGSRALTSYGREACQTLIEGLAGYPVSIVSGLALGADACAHRAALHAGLHTIAVPGSGLAKDVLYPRAHVHLAEEILDAGGLLLSEHPPDHRAREYDFPSRNRIMVGLADAVLMIEAGERSGTLITARMAGDYNRQLLCIPHRIGDPHAHGSHVFLRIGATLVSEPAHILEALGLEARDEQPALPLERLSDAERSVYDLLSEPRDRDSIVRECHLPLHETLTTLGLLELKGYIKEEFGLWRRI
ncbi:MAG TPA: DNA-processing protein DprA [Candidatus Paceibacterota bacterium]|nr:DNA-processing protein DprA [Candidatus Paceibacterota bacterium]